jgi:hypothetical protein
VELFFRTKLYQIFNTLAMTCFCKGASDVLQPASFQNTTNPNCPATSPADCKTWPRVRGVAQEIRGRTDREAASGDPTCGVLEFRGYLPQQHLPFLSEPSVLSCCRSSTPTNHPRNNIYISVDEAHSSGEYLRLNRDNCRIRHSMNCVRLNLQQTRSS